MTPFAVAHRCERDRGKRCIEINLYHTPINNDSYHHRHNFHAEADKEGFKSQHHQFTDLHGCHRRLHLHGQRTNINGSLAVDDTGSRIDYRLSNVKDCHCNCERIADQIDCDPCLDKILEEHPCIYQLRNEDSTRDYRFEPYDRLQATGLTVDKANYTEVYAAPLTAGTTLEDIYRTFNVDYPADFKGHSLSVSDVVVLHQNGQDTAHYCDSVGFQQVPEFLRENPLCTAELSTEQNENMIDGVLNNAPSLGELEAKAKAGEQISLTDLAAAVKAEEKAPKAKKSRTAKSKKPSIRAQLDAAKKEQSKQTQPREKTKELEV